MLTTSSTINRYPFPHTQHNFVALRPFLKEKIRHAPNVKSYAQCRDNLPKWGKTQKKTCYMTKINDNNAIKLLKNAIQAGEKLPLDDVYTHRKHYFIQEYVMEQLQETGVLIFKMSDQDQKHTMEYMYDKIIAKKDISSFEEKTVYTTIELRRHGSKDQNDENSVMDKIEEIIEHALNIDYGDISNVGSHLKDSIVALVKDFDAIKRGSEVIRATNIKRYGEKERECVWHTDGTLCTIAVSQHGGTEILPVKRERLKVKDGDVTMWLGSAQGRFSIFSHSDDIDPSIYEENNVKGVMHAIPSHYDESEKYRFFWGITR